MTQEFAATLVVVDMQEGMHSSFDEETLAAVEEEIVDAVREHRPVIVLEFWHRDKFGPTHERLMRHLWGYDRCAVWIKESPDGSGEVVEASLEHGFPMNHFRFVGVDKYVCLAQSACGTAKRLPASVVEVVKRACNQQYVSKEDWKHFPAAPNLVLVEDPAINNQSERGGA